MAEVGGKKVLVVEDDPDAVETLRIVLEDGGYSVSSARNAAEGLEKVHADRPDIILLDIMMPEGTEGFHLVWELRKDEDEACRNIPIIVLTAIHDRSWVKFYPDQTDPVYKPPGQWQTFEIHFQAPRFDAAGKKTTNAKFLKVILNGKTIHENVELASQTGGALGPERPVGPLMFQGDHGPVAFRNIRIESLPFDGKTLSGWTLRGKRTSHWTVGAARLDPADPTKLLAATGGTDLVHTGKGGIDIYTDTLHGDCIAFVDVMVPKGSNSGVYLQGEYEIQVLDSFGRTTFRQGDMGGIYKTAAPADPKYKPPGQWQSFEIHFLAPRFDPAGKKTANAKFLKVLLNGSVIHKDVEVAGPTGGHLGPERPYGPFMFQGDHGPVAFRNIRIIPLGFAAAAPAPAEK